MISKQFSLHPKNSTIKFRTFSNKSTHNFGCCRSSSGGKRTWTSDTHMSVEWPHARIKHVHTHCARLDEIYSRHLSGWPRMDERTKIRRGFGAPRLGERESRGDLCALLEWAARGATRKSTYEEGLKREARNHGELSPRKEAKRGVEKKRKSSPRNDFQGKGLRRSFVIRFRDRSKSTKKHVSCVTLVCSFCDSREIPSDTEKIAFLRCFRSERAGRENGRNQQLARNL